MNESYGLIRAASDFVLAVPGENMADATMVCGRRSVKRIDKVKALGFELVASRRIAVPGLLRAIANVELHKVAEIETGDHVLVVGQVLRFAVNTSVGERPLLSVGRDTRGYEVLSHEGRHRLAVVGRD